MCSDAKSESDKKRVNGFEPSTFSLGSCEHRMEPANKQELADAPQDACTSACTGNAESGHDDPDLAAIVAAWPTLPEPVKAGIVWMVEASR